MEPLLFAARNRLDAALEVFLASVTAYPGFDPGQRLTPKQSEPLDALSDRYLRAFESALRFFRTWEQVREAAPSESFRDLLLRMEKLGFISEMGIWLTLRDVRNRIAHEYLPDELARIFASLFGPAATEFRRLRDHARDVA